MLVLGSFTWKKICPTLMTASGMKGKRSAYRCEVSALTKRHYDAECPVLVDETVLITCKFEKWS